MGRSGRSRALHSPLFTSSGEGCPGRVCETPNVRIAHGLRSVAHPGLGEEIVDVALHRGLRDVGNRSSAVTAQPHHRTTAATPAPACCAPKAAAISSAMSPREGHSRCSRLVRKNAHAVQAQPSTPSSPTATSQGPNFPAVTLPQSARASRSARTDQAMTARGRVRPCRESASLPGECLPGRPTRPGSACHTRPFHAGCDDGPPTASPYAGLIPRARQVSTPLRASSVSARAAMRAALP